ncbi:MAG TPA: hypothetical protein VFC71_06030 [Candidatus Polarisedimenticolia bacterium]|nr:hypothetical protein [Candidatus Polarisedimenticolia bacterium]
MTMPAPAVATALADLRARWGAAAPRLATEVVGALAIAPLPVETPGNETAAPDGQPSGLPLEREIGRVHSTGFTALDGILGQGGIPRGTFAAFRGDASSGRTTLALRHVAEAQASGAIVAWLDLAGALDPVEAVARGVRPEWLVVVSPADLDEGLSIVGALLSGRTVDLVVIDLPPRPKAGRLGDRLGRLAALGRRAGVSVVVLEPADLLSGLATAVAETAGLRLELARRSWVHLGRDVVGQRTEVLVARNRAGPSGRRASLRILYADGGERDACLRRAGLLVEPTVDAPANLVPGTIRDATSPSSSTASPARSRPGTPGLRLVAGGPDRPRRDAVVGRDGAGRRPGGPGTRRPARADARGSRAAGARGDVPGARTGS